MKNAVYIISHDKNGRAAFGPFRSIEFICINTSYPKFTNDTITYSVKKLNGEHDKVTVSMIHTIQAEP